MNDRDFAKSVSSKPLFEVEHMTTLISILDPSTGKKKVALTYQPIHMRVYRQVQELTQSEVKGTTYCRWDPKPQKGQTRLWCLLDLCNGCAGESTGPLWVFMFHTRADARAYRKHLEALRASGQNVVKVSTIFCMWN